MATDTLGPVSWILAAKVSIKFVFCAKYVF